MEVKDFIKWIRDTLIFLYVTTGLLYIMGNPHLFEEAEGLWRLILYILTTILWLPMIVSMYISQF